MTENPYTTKREGEKKIKHFHIDHNHVFNYFNHNCELRYGAKNNKQFSNSHPHNGLLTKLKTHRIIKDFQAVFVFVNFFFVIKSNISQLKFILN